MNELEFKEKLWKRLQVELDDCDVNVEKDKNLIYRVIVDENFAFKPDTPKNPKRGRFAFQTDLLITNKNNSLPLVVIELKYKKDKKFTTHSILTYSAKALRHKTIYPYLRYGLVLGGKKELPNKFFIHNTGFDFAYALDSIDDSDSIRELAKVLEQQIKNARLLLDIITINRNPRRKFNTIIEIE